MPTPTEDFKLAIDTVKCQVLRQCSAVKPDPCEHSYLELIRCIEAIYNSYVAEYQTGQRRSELITQLEGEIRNLKAGIGV